MKTNKKEKLVPELRFPEFKEEWENSKLGNIAEFDKGKNISKADISEDGEIECIRYGELYTRYKEIIEKVYSQTNLDKEELVFSEKGDVLTPSSGETAIDIATASCINNDGVALGGDINIIKSDINGNFLAYYLSNKKKANVARLAQGVSVIHLYKNHLKSLSVNFPSPEEQQKIAIFLSLIDKKIELLKKKKELLELYKKGVMQKIFNREIRFKDKNGNDYPEWEEKRLGEIFLERSEKGFDKQELLSVTQDRGVIKRSEIEGVNNASDNRSGYKHVLPKDIVYNSMRMWQGASGLSRYEGIVSPAYTVVYPRQEESMHFYKYLFKFPRVVYNFRRYSQGLTSDTWNLKYPQFSVIRIERPNIEEQEKIAGVLINLDNLLKNIMQQSNLLKNFKRGLLQKLFI